MAETEEGIQLSMYVTVSDFVAPGWQSRRLTAGNPLLVLEIGRLIDPLGNVLPEILESAFRLFRFLAVPRFVHGMVYAIGLHALLQNQG